MKSKSVTFLLLMLSLTGQLFAQGNNEPRVHAFSAEQAVDYALKQSAQVKNALLDIQSQLAQNKEITSAALPSINVSGGITYNPKVAVQMVPDFLSPAVVGVLQQNNIVDANGNPIKTPSSTGYFPIGFGTTWSANGAVDFQQLLFDGQVFIGLQARRAAIRNAELSAEITQEQIKANVLKIYYQLVVGKRQIGTLDANIANYEQLLHDTREIYRNGFAEKLDVDKVQVQLINLQTQREKARNQLEAGNEGLKFLLNMPQQDQLILTDTLSDAELKSNLLDREYRYEDRKEYLQLETALELGKYNVKRYQYSKFPTVSLSANYAESGQWQKLQLFKGPWYNSSFLALRVSMSLFDGGAKNARIEQAKIELQKLQNNKQLLELNIENDITQAKMNIKSALTTLDAQKRNIELAEQVYRTTKLKYEQGVGSNQEISTAQADLVTAQNNYYGSLYDAIIAKIDYLKATGKL